MLSCAIGSESVGAVRAFISYHFLLSVNERAICGKECLFVAVPVGSKWFLALCSAAAVARKWYPSHLRTGSTGTREVGNWVAGASAVLAEGGKGDKDFLAYDVFTHALCEAGEDNEFHFEMHNTKRRTEAEERDERFRVEQQGPQSYVSGATFSLGPSRNGVAERQKKMEIISQQ